MGHREVVKYNASGTYPKPELGIASKIWDDNNVSWAQAGVMLDYTDYFI